MNVSHVTVVAAVMMAAVVLWPWPDPVDTFVDKAEDSLGRAVNKVAAAAQGLGCAYIESIVESLHGTLASKGKVTCCDLNAQLQRLENAMAARVQRSTLSARIKRELHDYRIGVIESIKKAFEPTCDVGGRINASLTRSTLRGVRAAYCKGKPMVVADDSATWRLLAQRHASQAAALAHSLTRCRPTLARQADKLVRATARAAQRAEAAATAAQARRAATNAATSTKALQALSKTATNDCDFL